MVSFFGSAMAGPPQLTLRERVDLRGVGSFSGEKCHVRLHPADIGTGRVLRVGSESVRCHVPAIAVDTVHTTAIAVGASRVRAIEHLMSALYFHNVDNCLIELMKGNEIPNRRSSSCREYCDAILSAGIMSQTAPSEVRPITQPGSFAWEQSSARVRPSSSQHLDLSVQISFPPPIGIQSAVWSSAPQSTYHREFEYTNARSFFRRDLNHRWPDGRTHWDFVRDSLRGLPQRTEDLTILAFRDGKWVVKPKYEDEPAWHKLMDLTGDLGLLGFRVAGALDVDKPGHAFNHRLLRWLGGTYRPDMTVTARLD